MSKEALTLLKNDMQWVISQEKLKKMTFPAEKPARFSWKDVSRGIAYIKIKLMVLQDDIGERNAVSAYRALRGIVDTTYRLLEILQQSPNVRRFRETTGL